VVQQVSCGTLFEVDSVKDVSKYMTSLTRRQWMWLLAALTVATSLKLYLAIATNGTTDVDGFIDQLIKIRELGVGAYRVRGPFNNPFNHPPPMIHVLKVLGYVSELSAIAFKFWLRLLPILACIGSFFIVSRLLGERKDRFGLLVALAVCPISIMVDGYHGNTDSVMIMFVLLAIYLIETRTAAWFAGFAFGLGCCIKIAPLMLVPAFLLFLPDWKRRLQFSVTAALVFITSSLPYILQDPLAVKDSVFSYQPVYGIWGIPQLLAMFYPVHPTYAYQPYDPVGIHGVFAAVLKYINIAVICAVSIWINAKKEPPRLFIQCGVVIAVSLFLTSGFGMQYLVWLVPFVIVLGMRTTLIYYVTGSLYLLLKYAGIEDYPNRILILVAALFSLAAWYSVRIVLSHYRRQLQVDSSR